MPPAGCCGTFHGYIEPVAIAAVAGAVTVAVGASVAAIGKFFLIARHLHYLAPYKCVREKQRGGNEKRRREEERWTDRERKRQIENNALRPLRSYAASSFCLAHFAALLITSACADEHMFVCVYASYVCLYVVCVSVCVNCSVFGAFAFLGFVTLPKS